MKPRGAWRLTALTSLAAAALAGCASAPAPQAPQPPQPTTLPPGFVVPVQLPPPGRADSGPSTLRPQLTPAQAATHRLEDYLAQGPSPWVPAPLADLRLATPDFVVAADGRGTHRTVQAAVDAVPAAGQGAQGNRYVIQVQPGNYRETLCIRDKAPLALLGSALNPAGTVIVEGRYANQPKPVGQPAHPCVPDLHLDTHGTAGSTSVAVLSDDVQIAHLTIANDAMEGVRDGTPYPPGAGESGGAQGVALTTAGDRIQLENVRLVSHQDTLYARARTPGRDGQPGSPARVLVRHSLIAGDVDFIFGDATLAITHSTVLTRAGRRKPGNGGHVLAPSTSPGTRLGLLVTHSRLIGEPGIAPGTHSLGRAWDFGVARGAWLPTSPNGQALVRDSELGPHLGAWAPSTSRRPFADTGPAANRMAEFNNLAAP